MKRVKKSNSLIEKDSISPYPMTPVIYTNNTGVVLEETISPSSIRAEIVTQQTYLVPTSVSNSNSNSNCLGIGSVTAGILRILIYWIPLLGIVGLLLGCVATQHTEAKSKAAKIAKTVNLYLLDMELSSPPDNFKLEFLLLSPKEGGGPQGPYLESTDDLIDPWGNSFTILVPGNVNPWFDIVSSGKDGKLGGAGLSRDITQ